MVSLQVCGYCKKPQNNLQQLNNNDLLNMMKQFDRTYTRQTLFCGTCRGRMVAKYARRMENARIAARKAGGISSNSESRTFSHFLSSGKKIIRCEKFFS